MNLFQWVTRSGVKGIIFLSIIAVTAVNFNQERWRLKDVIAQDVTNYYAYLPALFYEQDLSLAFLDDTLNQTEEDRYYAPNRSPGGNPVIKMSMGMSVSYLPFFGLAHCYAIFFNYPTTGFSEPYHFALLFSSLFYHVIGLLFLWKTLKRFYSHNTSMLTLFCLCFATNVFFYLTMGGALSHTVGFAFVSIFVYYTIRWHEQPALWRAVIIGGTLGFLVLVRPINFILILFFLLYPGNNRLALKEKFNLIGSQKISIVLMCVTGFLVVLPQLLYWKYVTGHYIFNSYVDEGFYFNNPHIWQGLLGFRKGWLIYTPVMIFSVIGFFYLKGTTRVFLVPVSVLMVVYVYVAFSWWCWWYGGSFGQRVLIDVYPLLALPFAAFLSHVNESVYWRRPVYILIAFFTCLNLFQSMQAKYNIIHYDSMTMENYFRVFGTTTKQDDREKYLRHPDYEKALRGEDEN